MTKPLNRYSKNSDAKKGDRVLFDNRNGFVKNLPSATCVGTVTDIVGDEDLWVEFKLQDSTLATARINYLLLK